MKVSLNKTSDPPAVVVAGHDGRVVSQNGPARELLGDAEGKKCWEVVGGVTEGEGFPCRVGCVRQLLARGLERSQQTRVAVAGRRHMLTCVPLADEAVCVLTATAERPRDPGQKLTAREREILQLLSKGMKTAAMAAQLGLSESTVRAHVEHMRSKLGVSTRAALVARGTELGFLD